MTKLYIIQSYNTTESDLYNVDSTYIENIVTDNEDEAKKIEDFIADYNERCTGVDDMIDSPPNTFVIDLGNTVLDPTIKLDTLESVKKTHTYN